MTASHERNRADILSLLDMAHGRINSAAQEIHFAGLHDKSLNKARTPVRAALTQLKVALEKMEEHDAATANH